MKANQNKIGEYNILHDVKIGGKQIVIGEHPNAINPEERYLCCYVEDNGIFELHPGALVSDNYAEIIRIFGERVTTAARNHLQNLEKAERAVKNNSPLFLSDCTPITSEDCLEGRVIVINSDILSPEFRYATYQLMYCTGGFGSQPNARGRTCYCTPLYMEEEPTSYYRSDILGTISFENLPKWAQENVQKIIQDKKTKSRRNAK